MSLNKENTREMSHKEKLLRVNELIDSAIAKLEKLRTAEDPHVIVMTMPEHNKEISFEACCCDGFMVQAAHQLLSEANCSPMQFTRLIGERFGIEAVMTVSSPGKEITKSAGPIVMGRGGEA